MEYKFGDIVLVTFPFTNLQSSKLRPAITVSDYNEDLVLLFISSKLKWQTEFDVYIKANDINGLKVDSLIKLCKIATLEKSIVVGKLGKISEEQSEIVKNNLIEIIRNSV